ncbi:gp47 [Salisaeta icosahedral phage 1]|uniref:gp47 n=1 Tax=Salisaeta icosahedral phage 1 TaxID=1183239 RepID=UPI00025EA93C|nr:gp47 [Salisaeta icosahedral phage 1]AFJ21502.1 gp47 [Salisaeta icosahedral phage 1]
MIDFTDEQLPGTNYTPSASGVAKANDKVSFEIYGLNKQRFGVTRMLVSTSDDDAIRVDVDTENGENTQFSKVLPEALQRFFADYQLPVPFVIKTTQFMKVTFTNTSASDVDVSVMVQGLKDDQLAVREQTLREKFGRLPSVEFAYGTAEIGAGASLLPVDLFTPVGTWKTKRFAIGTTATGASVRKLSARLMKGNNTLKREVVLPLLRQQFENGQMEVVPYTFENFAAVDVEVSNSDTVAHTVSAFTALLPPFVYE